MIWYLIGVLLFLGLVLSHMIFYLIGVKVGENRLSRINRAINTGQIWPTGLNKEDWKP